MRHIKQEKVDWNTFSGLGVFDILLSTGVKVEPKDTMEGIRLGTG